MFEHTPAPPVSNRRAAVALAMSLVGLFCVPVVLSIAAIAVALSARQQIARSPGNVVNRTMPTWAIWLGVLGIVLGVPQVWHWFN
jgi:hypothetical protein